MGASTVASQRPLPFPDTQSTRNPSYASQVMSSIPNDHRLGGRPTSHLTGAASRPLPLASSSLSAPSLYDTESTKDTRIPRSSVLTGSGAVSDAFSPSGTHSGSPNPSQAGGSSLYYAGHMTGSWPGPGMPPPSTYTYGNSGSGTPGSGPLAPPSYNRTPASYGSAPSPSHQHFPGRGSSSASNSENLPPPSQPPPTPSQSYHDQQSFPSPLGIGGAGVAGGGSLGSPLHPPGGSQQSGLSHPLLSSAGQSATRQAASGQNTQGGGPNTAPDGSGYRLPPTPSNYYPQSSAPQQPSFSSYASSMTQPPTPQGMPPATSPGSAPRGSGSIPAMSPPLQYPATRPHPSMASYATYNSIPGPIMSNMHHPGAPLTMVGGGMSGLSSYNQHPGLSPHHPHSLYVHPGTPSPQSERPFKCTENGCLQAFNRNHDLKRHQRIHLAVKPFACGDCDKRFTRKDALKRHRLVKGCGGNISAPAAGNASAATGGKGESPTDRDSAGAGDRGASPGLGKNEDTRGVASLQ